MIEIDSDIKTTLSQVVKITQQVPFATAKALNATAQEVQAAEGANMGRQLHVRTDWWKPGRMFGINIAFASKTNQEARVGSKADWLKLQEQGGNKVPAKKLLAVATIGGARPDLLAPIPRANAPRRLKQGFVLQFKSGKRGLYIREGKQIHLMFTLITGAKVKGVLGFDETGRSIVDRRYETNFDLAFAEAVRTAK